MDAVAENKHEMSTASTADEGLAEQEIREQVENRMKGALSVDTSETETVSVDYDRLSIKSIGSSASTTPTKHSSGLSTPTRRQSSTPPPATRTPGSGDADKYPKHNVGDRSIQTPTSSHGNRPHRPGILWKENGKIESMDFQKKWFHARIVEIDDTDNTVLIHFDGWNQRFDEWISMDSERLRPITRHSGRKEKRSTAKAPAKSEHKLGDNVFAKWTDCRMYAGTIVGINTNGSYDVRFYDGFKKTVQPINVKTMSLEVQKEYAVAGILPNPEKNRKLRIQLAEQTERDRMIEGVKKQISGTSCAKASAKKSRKDGHQDDSSTCSNSRTSSPCTSAQPSPSIKVTPKQATSSEKTPKSDKTTPVEPKPAQLLGTKITPPKSKLHIGGNFPVKKARGHTGKPVMRKKELKDKVKAELDMYRTDMSGDLQSLEQGNPMKVTPNKERNPRRNTSDRSKVKRVRHQKPKTIADEEMYSSGDNLTLAEVNKQRHGSISKENVSKGENYTQIHSAQKIPKTPTEIAAPTKVSYHSYEYVTTEPEKAFKVEEQHNKFKCPFDDCNKTFRKMSLVEYHVKYYHTEDGKLLQPLLPPAARKRKHTLSVCSSDSEVSASGWGNSGWGSSSKTTNQKRRRESSVHSTNPMEISGDAASIGEEMGIHDFSEVETHTTTTEEPDQKDAVTTDYSKEGTYIAVDCLSRDEVVNCICQINEENGLMIQCDVCLCWQHALCMEITEETLPSKYVCYVCANPPGVRDSQRYVYDQDWLKQGTMASLGFLPDDPYMPQKAQIIQATHSLVGDMHGVKSILSSVDCQLDAIRKPNHPEVKFWTKDWDKVNKERKSKKQLRVEEEMDQMTQLITKVKTEPTQDGTSDPNESQNLPLLTEIKQEIIDIKLEPEDNMHADDQQIINSANNIEVPATGDSTSDNQPEQICLEGGHPSSSSLSSLRSAASEAGLRPSTSAVSLASSKDSEEVLSPAVVSVQEEPFATCDQNLLQHINSMQDNVESRLELIEEQIMALESADDNGNNHSSGDILRDLPRVKKTIHQILNDLVKVKRISLYH